MPIHLAGQQVVGMIIHYYKEYEGKDVTVSFTCGKVINNKKYEPTKGVVHFDVSEVVQIGEMQEIRRIPLEEGKFDDIIATVLREAEFEPESISFDADPNRPLSFAGITVVGEKMVKSTEDEKHM